MNPPTNLCHRDVERLNSQDFEMRGEAVINFAFAA